MQYRVYFDMINSYGNRGGWSILGKDTTQSIDVGPINSWIWSQAMFRNWLWKPQQIASADLSWCISNININNNNKLIYQVAVVTDPQPTNSEVCLPISWVCTVILIWYMQSVLMSLWYLCYGNVWFCCAIALPDYCPAIIECPADELFWVTRLVLSLHCLFSTYAVDWAKVNHMLTPPDYNAFHSMQSSPTRV